MKALSLVIPCYNEALNIPLIAKKCEEMVPKGLQIEVVLVNNGSTDQTAEAIRSVAKKRPHLFVFCNIEKNIGYGHGILTGLEMAQSPVLAWTHADMQTDPKDVIKAYELYLSQHDQSVLVKGQRSNRAFLPNLFTWGMGIIASVALGEKLEDIGAQPKLFSRKFYTEHLAKKAPHDFSLDLYTMFCAKKWGSISTFPVFFKKRAFGEAKGGGSIKTRLLVTLRVLDFIFKLRWKIKAEKIV
jgi:glycosyltransferase involved in cell wall biosynthesis